MNLENIRQNSLKMILQFAIPSIIAMVLTSLITVADGYFVGNYIGKAGIAAVNLGLPVTYFYLAIGLMISVGGIAIAGRLFGAGEVEEANQIFRQTIATVTIIVAVLTVIILCTFPVIMRFLGAKGAVATCFRQYYLLILPELAILIINSSLGMFIRGEGNPQFYMLVNICNVALNVVLDAVFTVGFHMGMSGIALSSLIAALVAFVMSLVYFKVCAKVYHFGKFTFHKEEFKNMIFNGSSEFIGELSMCISMYAYNRVILREVGVDGVAAFSIIGYVAYIFSMIVLGFGQGIIPLVSFTFGAKDFELTKKLRRLTNKCMLIVSFAVMIGLFFGANGYSEFFTKEEAVRKLVHQGLLIYLITFPFVSINSIASFFFTSIGRIKESAVISSAHGLVLLLIAINVLPIFLGMTGVWLVSPVTEGLTALISGYYYVRYDHQMSSFQESIA